MIMFPSLILAVVVGFAYYELTDISADLSQASLVRAPIIAATGDIDSAINAIVRRVYEVQGATSQNTRIQYMKQLREELKAMDESQQSYLSLPRSAEMIQMYKPALEIWENSKPVLEQIYSQFEKSTKQGNQVAMDLLNEKIEPSFEKMMDIVEEMARIRQKMITEDAAKNIEDAKHGLWLMILIGSLSIIVLFVIGFTIAVRLANALAAISRMIGDSSTQVATASDQVSHSSQQLATSSTEQASAVEETSASLEEISGMVENTLKYAESGLQSVEKVKTVTEHGNESMRSLAQAMDAVMESNQRIEKLVKVIEEIGEKTEVIDEIVFQTKLLSFNASVEAERAGEHGRGFAVVAQEVGNLAQMSGKAALEISGIVKSGTIEAQEIVSQNKIRVEKGNQHVQETAQILKEIQKNAESVLIGSRQIQSASKEQASGIKQISQAMENINKVTQETAATSEESASAGEELSAQAEHLAGLVSEMNMIVAGEKTEGSPQKTHVPQVKNVYPLVKNNKRVEQFKMASGEGWEKL